MRDYYEAEMRLLQEAAQDFARAYPEQAGMLNPQALCDRDPYVERLLEGMAFLTAQVRRRIDDDVPELCETLLNQLWPQLLRPFPSATMIQFAPRPGQLQQTQVLKKGTMLLSSPVGEEERVICRFRTTSPTTVHPLRLCRLELREVPAGSRLTLGFQFDAGVEGHALDLRDFKLYLHAQPATAMQAHQALVSQVRSVRVHFPDSPQEAPSLLGGPERILPCHLEPEDLLLPVSGRSFSGFHLLQEYFAFREKFLFVRVAGLETIEWPRQARGFDLEIELGGPLAAECTLKREHIRLFCAPAVNLFSAAGEPIHFDGRRNDYPVVADAVSREGVEVYSVDGVEGTEMASGRRISYRPFHSLGRSGEERFFRAVSRERGGGAAVSLELEGGAEEGRQTLSCALTASNGNHPRRFLQEGEINARAPDTPAWVEFLNIVRPGRLLRAPRREDFRLALISHLSLNLGTLTEAGSFRGLLSLYDWTEQEQNRRRIEGVRNLEVRPVDRIRRGALMRGLQVELTVQEDHFLCAADIHLFGQVLHRFFGMYATVNTFIETRIVCHPSRKEFAWKPLLGEKFQL